MDLPQPPPDQDLKNIIDKLAQFVARNGQEFEQMTKSKQKDNQKFSFLFGGEFFNYYQYKVTTEQAIIKHRQQHQPQQLHLQQQPPPTTIPNSPQTYPPPLAAYPTSAQYPTYSYPQASITQQQQQQQQYPPTSQAPASYPQQPPYAPNTPSYPPAATHQQQQGYQGQNGGYGGPPQYGDHCGDPSQPPQYSDAYSAPAAVDLQQQQQQHHSQQHPQHYDSQPQPPPEQQQHPPPGTTDAYLASSLANVSVTNTVSGSSLSVPPPLPASSESSGTAATVAASAAATAAIDSIVQQQVALKEQIKQSEHNLTAQHQVLQQQKEGQVKEGVYVARGELLKTEADELQLVPSELSDLLTTITESCTKDSISAGKLWIFTNATDERRNNWIAQYLNYQATSYTAPFTHKLHIIYLMNDVLHSCQRKGSVELKDRLLAVLVPMFCHASTTAPQDKKAKLDKLLSLWEGKLELAESILQQLHNPLESWAALEKEYLDQFPQVTHTITHHLDTTFEGYKQQHNAFVQHAATQLGHLEQQKAQLEHQQQQAAVAAAAAAVQHQLQPPPMEQLCLPPPGYSQQQAPPAVPIVDFSKPPPGFPSGGLSLPGNLPPDNGHPGGENIPPQHQAMPQKENLVPSVPYFELPAGLMCPMVADDEHKYRPLEPNKLRLPPPAPPTERLLRAVENFYLPPSHERPRNSSEGWEQLSLYDYYKSKSEAVKSKQEQMESGDRERSESPPAVVILPPPPEKPEPDVPYRRYSSVSPEKEEPNNTTPHERFEPNKSPRRSPVRGDGRELYSPTRSPRSDRRYSPSASRRSPPSRRSPRRSPPPPSLRRSPRRSPRSGRSPRRTRSRSTSPGSRSRSGSPTDRIPFKRSVSGSPPPPSFGGAEQFEPPDHRLSESNKGHQMLKKMGWGGSGLGLKEQGIENPIDAGEVRDNPQERFRGLGVSSVKNDPFEAFRKNKGKAFITRMKARAEEKI